MKENKIKNILPKIELSKVKILKKIDLINLPTLNEDAISNMKSKKIFSKKHLNSIRKLTQLKVKEDSKNNQIQSRFLNRLMKLKRIYPLKNNKSFAQMAKEIAEKNMTNYLNSNLSYDIFEGAYVTESEEEDDIYNDNNEDNPENTQNNYPLSMRIRRESKKLNRNYSQDFIKIRNTVLKNDKKKINQFQKLLKNNRYNKIQIKIKNKDFKNLLSSYNAISQNKMIYDNITKNYRRTMLSEYEESIYKLNPIIKMKGKNMHQKIYFN